MYSLISDVTFGGAAGKRGLDVGPKTCGLHASQLSPTKLWPGASRAWRCS